MMLAETNENGNILRVYETIEECATKTGINDDIIEQMLAGLIDNKFVRRIYQLDQHYQLIEPKRTSKKAIKVGMYNDEGELVQWFASKKDAALWCGDTEYGPLNRAIKNGTKLKNKYWKILED